MSRLRIFLSSPGDVGRERFRAQLVIQKLARQYRRYFDIEPYLWDYEPMLASQHFQDSIDPPSRADIVVLIVWSRLGTLLPEKTAVREYRAADGRVPVTGTEWEFEDALSANQKNGSPDLLAFRRNETALTPVSDASRREKDIRQYEALTIFWSRYFKDGDQFVAGAYEYTTLEEFDTKVEQALGKLIEQRITKRREDRSRAIWLKGSPFRGLLAYDFGDAPIFFGREAEKRESLTRLQDAADRGTAFLLISGASGSGKSSLARAGLLPALVAAKAVANVGLWRRASFRPGEITGDPILALARALLSSDSSKGEGLPELAGSSVKTEELAAHLRAAADDPGFLFKKALRELAEAERERRALLRHEEARLVLLVDQLEEIFTRTEISPDDRAVFLRLLANLARSGVVWIVATIRSDLWHRASGALVPLVEAGARFDLEAPNGPQLHEMICQPAIAAGIAFEKHPETEIGLDDVIADAAAAEPGVLPLLSVLLETLYQRDIDGCWEDSVFPCLTYATYRDLGELSGAIAHRADAVFAELSAVDEAAVRSLPKVLRELVTSQVGTDVTARAAPLAQFAEGSAERRLINAFVAPSTRLMVVQDSVKGPELRLAHEVLLKAWPRARDQIAADRRDIETKSRLEALLHRYDEAPTDRRARALLDGLSLEEGLDLRTRWGLAADTSLSRFIEASDIARRAEDEAKHQRARRWVLASSAAALIFAGIAVFAFVQTKLAGERRLQIESAIDELDRLSTASDIGDFGQDYRSAKLLDRESGAHALWRDIYATLSKMDVRNVKWQRKIAKKVDTLGKVQLQQSKLDNAQRSFEVGQKIRLEIAKREPKNAVSYADLATSFYNIGEALRSRSESGDAIANHQTALALVEHALSLDKRDEFQYAKAIIHYSLAEDLKAPGLPDADKARSNSQAALQILEGLVSRNPDNREWKRGLGWSHFWIGASIFEGRDADRVAKAHKHFQACFDLWNDLATSKPDDLVARHDLAWGHDVLGSVFNANKKFTEAEEHFSAAQNLRKELVKADEENVKWLKDLALSSRSLGDVAQSKGQSARALGFYQEAAERFQDLLSKSSDQTPRNVRLWRNLLLGVYARTAPIHNCSGNFQATIDDFDHMLNVREKILREQADSMASLSAVAGSEDALGQALQAKGDPSQALRHYTDSETLYKRVLEHDPHNKNARDQIAQIDRRIAALNAPPAGDVSPICPKPEAQP